MRDLLEGELHKYEIIKSNEVGDFDPLQLFLCVNGLFRIGDTMTNNEWFGTANLASFGGASFAVTVIVNTLRTLAKKKWSIITTQRVVFAICVLIAGFAVGLQSPKDFLSWLIMPLNACLLFCTALGLNEFGDKAKKSKIKGAIGESSFFESWIK